MTDLLAIIHPDDDADQLLDDVARAHPRRVTVLVDGPESDWATADTSGARAMRDRLASLLAAIERRTGALVVGTVGSRAQLRGWRFDQIVGGALAPA